MMNALPSTLIATNVTSAGVPDPKGVDFGHPLAFIGLLDRAEDVSPVPTLPLASPVAVSMEAAPQTHADGAGLLAQVPGMPEMAGAVPPDTQVSIMSAWACGGIDAAPSPESAAAAPAPVLDVNLPRVVPTVPLPADLHRISADVHGTMIGGELMARRSADTANPLQQPDLPPIPHHNDMSALEVEATAPRDPRRSATEVDAPAITAGPFGLPVPLQAFLPAEPPAPSLAPPDPNPDEGSKSLVFLETPPVAGHAILTQTVADQPASAGQRVAAAGGLGRGLHSDAPPRSAGQGRSIASPDRQMIVTQGADSTASVAVVSHITGRDTVHQSVPASGEGPAPELPEGRGRDADPPRTERPDAMDVAPRDEPLQATRLGAPIGDGPAGLSLSSRTEQVATAGDRLQRPEISRADPARAVGPRPLSPSASAQSPDSAPAQQSSASDPAMPDHSAEAVRAKAVPEIQWTATSGVVDPPPPAVGLWPAPAGRGESRDTATTLPMAPGLRSADLPEHLAELPRPLEKAAAGSQDLPEMPREHPSRESAPRLDPVAMTLSGSPATMAHNPGSTGPVMRQRGLPDIQVRVRPLPVRPNLVQPPGISRPSLSPAQALSRFRHMLNDAGQERPLAPAVPATPENSMMTRAAPPTELVSDRVTALPVGPLDEPVPQRAQVEMAPASLTAREQQPPDAPAILDPPDSPVIGLPARALRSVSTAAPAPVYVPAQAQGSALPSAAAQSPGAPRQAPPDERKAYAVETGALPTRQTPALATPATRVPDNEPHDPVAPAPAPAMRRQDVLSNPDDKPADPPRRDRAPANVGQTTVTETARPHAREPYQDHSHLPAAIPGQPAPPAEFTRQPIADPGEISAGSGQLPVPAQHATGPAPAAPASSVYGAMPAEKASRSLPKRTSAALVQSVATRGHSRAEVVLEPAELGRVRFDIATQGDRVQVTLSVERPETLDLLRRHAEELRQEFRAAGFDTGTLSFSQWGQRGEGGRPSDPAGPNAFADEASDIPPSSDTPQTPRPSLGGGLDLRL